MLFRNIKTGAVIDVNSIMTGDWQAVEPAGTTHASDDSRPVKPTTGKGASKNAAVRKSK